MTNIFNNAKNKVQSPKPSESPETTEETFNEKEYLDTPIDYAGMKVNNLKEANELNPTDGNPLSDEERQVLVNKVKDALKEKHKTHSSDQAYWETTVTPASKVIEEGEPLVKINDKPKFEEVDWDYKEPLVKRVSDDPGLVSTGNNSDESESDYKYVKANETAPDGTVKSYPTLLQKTSKGKWICIDSGNTAKAKYIEKFGKDPETGKSATDEEKDNAKATIESSKYKGSDTTVITETPIGEGEVATPEEAKKIAEEVAKNGGYTFGKAPKGWFKWTSDSGVSLSDEKYVSQKIGDDWYYTLKKNFSDDGKSAYEKELDKYNAIYDLPKKKGGSWAKALEQYKKDHSDWKYNDIVDFFNSTKWKSSKDYNKWVKDNAPKDPPKDPPKGKSTEADSETVDKSTEADSETVDNSKVDTGVVTDAMTNVGESVVDAINTRNVNPNIAEQKFAKYMNNNHANTIGAIINPNSGLDIVDRTLLAAQLLGKLTGNVILANGLSLLGDNSYWKYVGEGTGLRDLVSKGADMRADELSKQLAAEAVDITANQSVVNREMPKDMDKLKKDYISSVAHVLTSMSDGEVEDYLTDIQIPKIERSEDGEYTNEVLTFSPEEIALVNKLKPFFQNNSKTTRETSQSITETNSKRYDYYAKKYTTKSQAQEGLRGIQAKISELEAEKRNMSRASLGEIPALVEAYGKSMGAIGNSTTSVGSGSTQSRSQADTKAITSNSSWNVAGNAGVKIVDLINVGVSGGGGHNWGESNTTNSTLAGSGYNNINSGESFNRWYADAADDAKEIYNNWARNQGTAMLKAIIASIDRQIQSLKADYDSLSKLSGTLNDATIPNGLISSVILKNGKKVNVNKNDGAILTTNKIPHYLAFAEGEVNPFDYLGYEGNKLTPQEAETYFDKKEPTYDSIMSWLNS